MELSWQQNGGPDGVVAELRAALQESEGESAAAVRQAREASDKTVRAAESREMETRLALSHLTGEVAALKTLLSFERLRSAACTLPANAVGTASDPAWKNADEESSMMELRRWKLGWSLVRALSLQHPVGRLSYYPHTLPGPMSMPNPNPKSDLAGIGEQGCPAAASATDVTALGRHMGGTECPSTASGHQQR